jgi:hypothetical protein
MHNFQCYESEELIEFWFAHSLLGDQLFWSAGKEQPREEDYHNWYYSYRPPADVEMTGYALMSYLKREGSISDVTKIVKWLSKQRNNYGGFASTQVR